MTTTIEIAPHAVVKKLDEVHRVYVPKGYYLRLALFYAAFGFKVFPVHANKYPFKDFHWNERASNDPDKVKQMWKEYPYGRPAFYCAGSGVVVIDTDNKPIKKKFGFKILQALVRKLGPLPKTVLIYTQSFGTHMYFKLPENVNLRRNISNCIDIQNNAYCVCGGAEGDKGYYRFVEGFTFEDIGEIPELPQKWIDFLTVETKVYRENKTFEKHNTEPVQIEGDFQKMYDGCMWCKYCVDNAKNLGEIHWFRFASVLSRLKNGYELFDYFSKPHPEYSPQRTLAKFENAQKYSINCRTIASDFPECKSCKYYKK